MDVKISVIVPIYNTEKYLERCLTSIINQNLREIEIIVINDGSTDNSLRIAEKFKKIDKRIILINKENEGVSSARNKGLEIAKGEYIICLDSDDWIEQNYFFDLYTEAKKNDLDIVIADYYQDWDNGKIKEVKILDLKKDEIIDNKLYFEKFLNLQITSFIWDKLIKTSLYKDNDIRYPAEFSYGEDIVTLLDLGWKAKKIGKINKAYTHYIQNINSLSRKDGAKKIYKLIELLDHLEETHGKKIKGKYFELFKIHHMGIILLGNSYDLKDQFYQNAIKDYIKTIRNFGIVKGAGKKVYLYSLLLNINPTLRMFRYIYISNQKIKKIRKKN